MIGVLLAVEGDLRPTAAGSAPRRSRKNASLTTATRGPPGASSSRVNVRPMRGATPSAGKKPRETRIPSRRSGSPAPVRFTIAGRKAPSDSKERALAASDWKSDGVPRQLVVAEGARDRGAVPEQDDAVGVGIVEGLQEDAVDDAEHGRARADAEREGAGGDDGEAGLAAEGAGALAQLAGEGVEDVQRPRVATVLLDLRDAAEGEARASKGLGAGYALPLLEAVGFELDVLGQLGGEVGLEVLPGPLNARSRRRREFHMRLLLAPRCSR